MIDIALAQLIGQVAGVGTRVSPGTDAIADKTIPRVVYTLVSDPRRYSNDGPCGLRKATYQIDVFGKGYGEARSIAAKIAAPANATTNPGLDGWNGTQANTVIQRMYFGGDSVGRAEGNPGQNSSPARATVDVLIDYRELLQQPNFTT